MQSFLHPVIEPVLVQLVVVVGYSTRGLAAFPAAHREFAHLIHAFYEVGGISIDFVESLGGGPGTAVRHTRVASSQHCAKFSNSGVRTDQTTSRK